MWRCDRIHEFDDLMQDCFLIFHKICDKYPRVVEERHLFSLYRRAVVNQFHDRALYMKRKRVLHQDTSADVSDVFIGRIGEMTNAGYAAALLAEAPEDLKIALRLLTRFPKVLDNLPKIKHRENLNMKLRRALDLDPNFNFTDGMKDLFS